MDIKEIRRNRLGQLLGQFDTIKAFAERVATEPSIISAIKNNERNMGDEVARRIEERLGLSLGWMDHIPPRERPTVQEGRADYALVPKMDLRLSAGPGQLADHEEVQSTIAFRRDWLISQDFNIPKLVVLQADGDSMSPRIVHGDALLVDTSDSEIKSGKIYAIRVGDELRVKRLFIRVDGAILISSDNKSPEFPDEEIGRRELGQLNIIGRVVWSGGKL